MMPEQQQRILGYFIEEAKDHLNTIEQGLLNLQATIEDPEMVNEVFRAAHSVKGGAAMLDIGSIQRTSHRLEDYFKILKEAPTTRVDRTLESMFLQVFDGLQALLEELQGPFGLTEDKAQEVMAELEPVFEQLENHLNTVVAQAPVPSAAPPTAPVPAATSVPAPAQGSEDSALKLVFKSDVPSHLREMLSLFKQPDTEASRAALVACCDEMARIGEQFDLEAWGRLIEVTRSVVNNRDQTYRSLAPIVIKELKKAQEQILSGQSNAVRIAPDLEALAPLPEMPEPTSEDLDALLDDALAESEEPDLADLFASESQPIAEEEDLDWLTADTSEAETMAVEAPRPTPAPGDASAPPEPSVGVSELNSLADLFEGEMAGMETPWEEVSEAEAAIAEGGGPDLDLSEDFSDLLENSLEEEPSATDQDLADLFGAAALDLEAPTTEATPSPIEGATELLDEDFADLLDLSGDLPDTPSNASVDTDDDLDALLNQTVANPATSQDKPASEREAAADFPDLGDLFDQGNDADLATDLEQSPALEPTPDAPAPHESSDDLLSDLWDEMESDAQTGEIAPPATESTFADIADPWTTEDQEEDTSAEDALDALDELWAASEEVQTEAGDSPTSAEDSGDNFADFAALDLEDDGGSTEETASPENLADLLTTDAPETGDLSALFDESLSPTATAEVLEISPEDMPPGDQDTSDLDALLESSLEDNSLGAEMADLTADSDFDALFANSEPDTEADTLLADLEEPPAIEDTTVDEDLDALLGEDDASSAGDIGGEIRFEESTSVPDLDLDLDLADLTMATPAPESPGEEMTAFLIDTPADSDADDLLGKSSPATPDIDLAGDSDLSASPATASETPLEDWLDSAAPESPDQEGTPGDSEIDDFFADALPASPPEGDTGLDALDLAEAEVTSDTLLENAIAQTEAIAADLFDDETAGGEDHQDDITADLFGAETDLSQEDTADLFGAETAGGEDRQDDITADLFGAETDLSQEDTADLFGAETAGVEENTEDSAAPFADEALLPGDNQDDITADLLGEDTALTDKDSRSLFDDIASDLEFAAEADAETLAATSGSPEAEPDWNPEETPITAPDDNFDNLEALLDDAAEDSSPDFDELEDLLAEEPAREAPLAEENAEVVHDGVDFDDLEALLDDDQDETPTASPAVSTEASEDDEFSDLEKLLEEADQTLGGSSPTLRSVGGGRSSRRVGGMVDQTMRVSVKHLDILNNLVGELVVNRNSLEQDQERLRQFLDNLLFQVQQLNDVGQRMRDLYERSLLESSLISSRQAFHSAGVRSGDRLGANGGNDHATGATFDALEMDRFTGFHTLSQEMIELIVRVRESASDIGYTVESADQITRQFRQVTTQLQEGLNKARMVPFAQTADRLPRAVRDISLKCGKEARLIVEGRDTLIDKMILERLYDPMTHLVNNAITHGIEAPDERAALGKPREGTITLRAFYQGNQTVIYIADDGAGINPDVVKRKAIKKGLITQAEANAMNTVETYELLFRPGFSTRDKADDFAGRGVGMDVVRTALSEIRGAISIDSEMGKGTSFTIRLPLTLSISKALSCLNNQARIAFPMDGVEDMFDVPKERIQTDTNGRTSIQWRDTNLTFQPLSELLQFNRSLGRGRVYGGSQDEDMVSIVVLRSANTFLGLQVDRVLGEQEIVIKQLEGPVPKPMGIAGATVLGDGRVMPIADVLELIDIAQGRVRREAGSSLWSQAEEPPAEAEVATTKAEPTVLIVDDSITVRELLSMSFNKVGYRVEQARDGQEAWEKLRSGLPCDLVFCDIEMPRMDGLELLSRLQKDSLLKRIPIAMLTSRGADRHRQMALDLGASGYFTKPYLEEVLLDAAQRMLNGEVLLSKSGDDL